MSRSGEPSLYKELTEYCRGSVYPFHMPGHKRQMGDEGFEDPFSFDITEISGFDNLHHAEGLLLDVQKKAARICASEETRFLINGSTAGLLSAVSGCVPEGGTLIMARNCHKAVYNAAYLRQLKTVYLYPEREPACGLNGGIRPGDVEAALEKNPDAGAVILTSPSYDGVVSDIRTIAGIVHSHGIPLIVDEAHGAHFSMHEKLPVSAIHLGADVVIQSVHKTLPSLTQTALIHFNGKYADRAKIRRYLSIYQSSSPSYVLMASIDRCMDFLETDRERFDILVRRVEAFRERMRNLKLLQVPGRELIGAHQIYDYDLSRIIISGKAAGISGQWIADRMYRDYEIELEMAAGSYAVAIASVMDSERGFERLAGAIEGLDAELSGKDHKNRDAEAADAEDAEDAKDVKDVKDIKDADTGYLQPIVRKTLAEGEDGPCEEILFAGSAGRISSEYVYLYPPGIPIIAPGEEITQELVDLCCRYKAQQMSLEGMRDPEGKRILVNL